MTENLNTFEEMNNEASNQTEEVQSSGEISIEDFSDTAIGESVKYVRPELHGKEDVVEKFQVFSPKTNEPASLSRSKSTEYWPVSIICTYASKNDDGVHNREYLSGCRCFKQRDGGASAPNFWYEGSTNQVSQLWEKVAENLNMKPEDLSPRQFVAFLNSKPKVQIEGQKFDNYNAPKGSPKQVTKNMIGEFL